MRTFVAVEVPDPIRDRLGVLLDRVKTALPRGAKAKWVRLANLHITLKFVGEVDEDRVPDLIAAVQRAAAERAAFSFDFTGLGAFPRPRKPRVLWVGTDEAAAVPFRKLAGAVDREVAKARLASREKRPFTAHLTLARSRSPKGEPALGEILETPTGLDGLTVPVEEVVVMQSILGPTGPSYVPLARPRLASEE